MARARLIKPGFFMNDGLAEVVLAGRLLFAGLWTISDREGRLEDRPKRIKAEVMPFDNVSIDRLLTDLAQRGFIVRYESEGQRFIQVVNFLKHQTPHMREPASTIPAPVEHCASTVPEQVKHQPGPAVTSEDPVIDPVRVTEPEDAADAAALPKDNPDKPIPLPKKTHPTETWAAEMREQYGPNLRDFDETLKFHMNGSYYRTCADKCAYLETKLKAAVEREMPKALAERRQPSEPTRYHPDADAEHIRAVNALLKRNASLG